MGKNKCGFKRVTFGISFFAIMLLFLVGCSKDKNKSNVDTVITDFETSEGKVVLEEVSLFSDKVEILLPKDFDLMSEELAKLKYPSDRRPTLIYTNEAASTNVTFNYLESKASSDDIDHYKDYFIDVFKNMYPSAEWYDDGIIQLDEKNIGYMEVLTPAIDTEVYNLIFFTDLDGKLLMVTVNCVKEQIDDWKPIAKAIMNSIKLNE